MTTRIEDELRDLLGTNAEGFEMDGTLPPRVLRRARARAFRAVSAVVVVAIVAGTVSVATLRGHPRGPARTTAGAPVVKLVNYIDDSDADGAGLEQYAQCMRGQGFDVPDPVRTDDGWRILVPADSIDRSSPGWQEAAFVTCRLTQFVDRPLSGDLVLGDRTPAEIDGFLACMQAQGFDLPEPTKRADGLYRYDLQTTPIDTSSEAWNRALFVTCAFPGD
ncbi:MAG: hypothetical protein M3Q23_18120 [Actinomycetota bacterium]|nr:hypothetical protein [Actinomycetota bacterium]